MASSQGKYDYLITKVLPIHKKLLSADNDKTTLIACVKELVELIATYDTAKAEKLKTLQYNLAFPNQHSKLKVAEKAVQTNCRNEALNILTRFLIELNPDEEKAPHHPISG